MPEPAQADVVDDPEVVEDLGRWNVRPTPSRVRWSGRSPCTGSPTTWTVPADARASPEMALSSVLLPAPLGPITPKVSPRATSKETEFTATSPPKRTVTSRT